MAAAKYLLSSREYLREVRRAGLQGGPIRSTLVGMGDDKTVPVIVTMRIKCGLDEDDTSEVDMLLDTREQVVTGECPDCGVPVWLHMKRWQLVQ